MAVTKFHARFRAFPVVLVVVGSLGLLASGAAAQDPEILGDIVAGNRQVVFEFSSVLGDTLTPEERQTVPDISALVDLDLGINTSGMRNADQLLARGALGRTLTEFVLRVGNFGDFYEVGQGPAVPPLSGLELAGAFQMGRNHVGVAFTNRVNATQALDTFNYSFSPPLSMASAILQDNGQTVILTSSADLPASTSYTVTVTGVSGEGGETLTGPNSAGFQTVAGPVTNIAALYDSLAAYPDTIITPTDTTVVTLAEADIQATVVGQIYIPAGSRGGTPDAFLQDGSGRGFNLAGGLLQSEVNDRGNVVAVTGTLTDTTVVGASLVDYASSLVATGQPYLGAKPLLMKDAIDNRWIGTYIQVRGRLARIDKETDPEVPSFNMTVTDTLFGGYQIWRADAETPDHFLLLRTYSLLDTTWTFRPGPLRMFADPDSIILRGTERDPDASDVLAGPFNGFGYIYAVTWFNAVVDITSIPSHTTIFTMSEPGGASVDEPVYPGNPARVAVPVLGKVTVVPNPYNPDAPYGRGAFPGPPRIQFTKLPRKARVFIYTVAGDLIRILDKADNPAIDAVDWDLKNDGGENIAPGIYMYRVIAQNETTVGRFVVAGAPAPR